MTADSTQSVQETVDSGKKLERPAQKKPADNNPLGSSLENPEPEKKPARKPRQRTAKNSTSLATETPAEAPAVIPATDKPSTADKPNKKEVSGKKVQDKTVTENDGIEPGQAQPAATTAAKAPQRRRRTRPAKAAAAPQAPDKMPPES